MSYVNAPATKMLATHCAVCARPLVDAQSVECGVGPDCRKKYAYDLPEAADDVREQANAIVRKIALVQKGAEAFALCRDLHKLGWVQLATRISERLTKIHVEDRGVDLAVTTPFEPGFVAALKAKHCGAQWDKKAKAWIVPATQEAKAALYAVLVEVFKGKWATGPKGPFVVGGV